MNILVTGGGGFLGSAVCRQLAEKGHDVVALQRRPATHLEPFGVRSVEADIDDADAVTRAAEGCDAIFHTAGKAGIWGDPADFRRVNVDGTTVSTAFAAEFEGTTADNTTVAAGTSTTVTVTLASQLPVTGPPDAVLATIENVDNDTDGAYDCADPDCAGDAACTGVELCFNGSDDDIIARQLREAATREEDPDLRQRLWEEYRAYKASLDSDNGAEG